MQQKQITVTFPSTVRSAASMLGGFALGYSQGDHHLGRQVINTAVAVNGSAVDVYVGFLLRDASGLIDDAFDGVIDVLVIVDRV